MSNVEKLEELEQHIDQDIKRLARLFKTPNAAAQTLHHADRLVHRLKSLNPQRLANIRKYYGLKALPDSIENIHPRLPDVLDIRAAIYLKLDKWDRAQDDASMMVLQAPSNCKGYLRLGRVHMKLGDNAKAVKVLTAGCRKMQQLIAENVKISDKLFVQLRGLLREARVGTKNVHPTKLEYGNLSSISPVSALDVGSKKRAKVVLDIMQILPTDIIEVIFRYLPGSLLLKCHLVSKLWYQTLTSLPSLYDDNLQVKRGVTADQFMDGLRLLLRILSKCQSGPFRHLRLGKTAGLGHLQTILEGVFKKSRNLQTLAIFDHNFSAELLLLCCDNIGWNVGALSRVEHAYFAFDSFISQENAILSLLSSLKSLEIYVMSNQLKRNQRAWTLLQNNERIKSRCVEFSRTSKFASLESLLLVNHTDFSHVKDRITPGPLSYMIDPPFLHIHLPRLTKLTLVSYDVTKVEASFADFLRRCCSLKYLFVEKVQGISVEWCTRFFLQGNPEFSLQDLTIREIPGIPVFDFPAHSTTQLSCLHHLELLDVYSSSITAVGLMRLVECFNASGRLNKLNIGNTQHINFQGDSFSSRHTLIQFTQLFVLAPALDQLFLPCTNIDTRTLVTLHSAISQRVPDRRFLSVLDLSFCNISGYDLVTFFKGTSLVNDAVITTQELRLLGINLADPGLENHLKQHYVKTLKIDPFRKKWEELNVNSWVPSA